jgi:hypothetical protein
LTRHRTLPISISSSASLRHPCRACGDTAYPQGTSNPRHVANPSDWRICWQVGNSDELGFSAHVRCRNQTISAFSCHSKEGPLPIRQAVPLYLRHYGKLRHMPPRESEPLDLPRQSLSSMVSANCHSSLTQLDPCIVAGNPWGYRVRLQVTFVVLAGAESRPPVDAS